MTQREKRPPVPLGLRTVRTSKYQLGMLYNPVQGTNTVVMTGAGSTIADLDYTAQASVLRAIAGVVERAAVVPGMSTGMSWLLRRRPARLADTWRYFQEGLHPGLLAIDEEIEGASEPYAEHVRTFLAQNALQLLEMEERETSHLTMAGVFTIGESGVFNRRRQRPLTEAEVDRAPIVRVARATAEGLSRAGIKGAVLLDRDELWAYVQSAWSLNPLVVPSSTVDPWPKHEIRASHRRFYTDGVEHAVLRVTETPKSVWPHFFNELRTVPGWVAVTLCGEMVTARKDNLVLGRAIPLKRALDDVTGKVYHTPDEKDRMAELERRHREITDEPFSQIYNILLCISGEEGTDQVAEGIDAFEAVALRMGLKVKQIVGAAWQPLAFWSATTGINLL